jgi:hypothetical protein
MIRQMLKLAFEAAKVEARNLVDAVVPPGVAAGHDSRGDTPGSGSDPGQDEVSTKPVQAVAPSTKWQSPQFHVDALGSRVCPDCDEPKRVGAYRCGACTRGK